MKRYPVTSFNIHSRSVGSVSLSEQPDRPGFRANFSRWGPGGLDLKPHPIRAVLKLPKTHPIRVSSGFDYLRTDQMFGLMPLLIPSQYYLSLIGAIPISLCNGKSLHTSPISTSPVTSGDRAGIAEISTRPI